MNALAVVRGEVHVATSHGYRRFASYYSKHVQHGRDVMEWFYPGAQVRGFVAGEGKTWCLWASETLVRVVDPNGPELAELPTGGEVKAWATVQGAAAIPELVTVGNSPGIRVWDTRPGEQGGTRHRPRFRGLGEDCVAGSFEGRRVLATSSGPVTLYDPRDGERLGVQQRDPQWLGRTADASVPPVLFGAASGPLSLCEARVLETADATTVSLEGSRMCVLSDLTVVRSRGRRLLAGTLSRTSDAVVLWDLGGKEVQRWSCGDLSSKSMLRTVEADGVLWLGACGRNTMWIHRYPGEEDSRKLTLPPPVRMRAVDLGPWQGRASIAYFDPGEHRLLMEDLADPRIVECWQFSPGTAVLDIVFVGARDLLVAVTSDERLHCYAPGSAQPIVSVHVGADIWSVAPVDDRLIGVASANALFALQLPPA